MNTFTGKVMLVSGGAVGAGAQVAERLAESGATVIIADSHADLVQRTVMNLRGKGFRAYPSHLDLRDDGQALQALQKSARELGRLDALINGAWIDSETTESPHDAFDWDQIVAARLRAPMLLSQKAFHIMKPQRSGHIINIISMTTTEKWMSASPVYACQWGLIGFSHSLHKDAQGFGVTVSALICDRHGGSLADTVTYLLSAPKGISISPCLLCND